MTYTGLNLVVLLLAATFALIAHRAAGGRTHDVTGRVASGDVARTGWLAPIRRRPRLFAGLAALAVMLVLTAVFDSIIVGVGLVAYDPARISGLYIGRAPVEDLAYTVGAVLVLPAVWRVLGLRDRRRRRGGRIRRPGRGGR